MSTKSNILKQFRIILCETSHAGNIGSVARAMKTMGFSNLYLVNPKDFPSKHAQALACGAEDILQKTIVVTSLEKALKNINHVVGFTTRKRELTQPHKNVRKLSKQLFNEAKNNKIALIFGNEIYGVSKEGIQSAKECVEINQHGIKKSMNVSVAAGITLWKIKNK